jgi:hypothetical protein
MVGKSNFLPQLVPPSKKNQESKIKHTKKQESLLSQHSLFPLSPRLYLYVLSFSLRIQPSRCIVVYSSYLMSMAAVSFLSRHKPSPFLLPFHFSFSNDAFFLLSLHGIGFVSAIGLEVTVEEENDFEGGVIEPAWRL